MPPGSVIALAHASYLLPHCFTVKNRRMTRLLAVEDQLAGGPTPHVNGGHESQKVKCLPAGYYTRFFSKAAHDLKLGSSELTPSRLR